MPKGYWVAHITVTTWMPTKLIAISFPASWPPMAENYRAGGNAEVVEGEARPRTVVIEFPSLLPRKAVTVRISAGTERCGLASGKTALEGG